MALNASSALGAKFLSGWYKRANFLVEKERGGGGGGE